MRMKPVNQSAWLIGGVTSTLMLAAMAAQHKSNAPVHWSFGVMDDTQWTCSSDPAGSNPQQMAKAIIDQVNAQFIGAGVKFVIQVGDLADTTSDSAIQARAEAARPLLEAGIGFFPMRGNHEVRAKSANNYGIPQFQASFPQTRGRTNTFGTADFNSPTSVSGDLDGMSYSFDYGAADSTARFVVIDPWATPGMHVTQGKFDYGYSIADQQSWIDTRLDKSSRGTTHAFVFSHQPVMAEHHQDTPFAGDTATNPAMQNAFFASLQTNDVRYYICGHDHIHQRSLVVSPDGLSTVEEVIGVSDSSKFYKPKATHDVGWAGQKYRETSLAQERGTVGYYIYTVDGPRVSVDYYADDHGNWGSDDAYPVEKTGNGFTNQVTPHFNFVKKETFGYSLNGGRFLVGQGSSYTTVVGSVVGGRAYGENYKGTTARILAGVNSSTNRDYTGRAFVREVNTGWAPSDLASDTLTLWGLADLGTNRTDTYVLSMTYDPAATTLSAVQAGAFGLVARPSRSSNWENATSLNEGGTPRFVPGPWQDRYALGAWGVDTNTATAWAVVNHGGDFAVGPVDPLTEAKARVVESLWR